jgi:hypothetical protein
VRYSQDELSVAALVEQFQHGALLVNPEYQRGAVWTVRQQGKFLDSMFRGYPVPAVFLRAIEHQGLRGTHSTFELIDGQQRLRALSDFLMDKLRIPSLSGPDRLRLPAKVAAAPAEWAGKTWTELNPDLQSALRATKLRVFIVEHPTSDDEVRDLFIRLQAGTALTRQQIRDAWPGPVSPFVESIGGKGRHEPKSSLLAMVDKRGDRGAEEDAKDPWVAHRQTCAQLLSVFMARERDAYARTRIAADDLDELYHEVSEFDATGNSARRFRDALRAAERVFAVAAANHPGRKTKWRKVHIFAVVMTVQDFLRSTNVPLNDKNLNLLADLTFAFEQEQQSSRFSGPAVTHAGESLRDTFFAKAGRLDERRQFNEEERQTLALSADGKCQICGRPVEAADAEYDHFPIPWAMCGPTSVENGRLVHRLCHPRGRPAKG